MASTNITEENIIAELKGRKNLKTFLYSNKYNVITLDTIIERAVNLDPSNVHLWYAWGVVSKLQDNIIDAEKKFRQALYFDPENVNVRLELGRVLTFRKLYEEAELNFLKLLDNNKITFSQVTQVLTYLADNYNDWAKTKYEENDINKFIRLSTYAFQSILLAMDLDPSDQQIQEYHKKICFDYGTKLCRLGRKDESRKYLIRVIAEVQYKGKAFSTDKERLAHSYFLLANYERENSPPDLKTLRYYVKMAKKYYPKDKVPKKLEKLAIYLLKTARIQGEITHFDLKKKFGIIETETANYIFFPKGLTWYCNDFKSLVKKNVTFLSAPNPTPERPDGRQAIQIRLLKQKKSPKREKRNKKGKIS